MRTKFYIDQNDFWLHEDVEFFIDMPCRVNINDTINIEYLIDQTDKVWRYVSEFKQLTFVAFGISYEKDSQGIYPVVNLEAE